MNIMFVIMILISFLGGILKSLLGWINAVKPDGTREQWSWRMFTGSMINVFISSVIWVGANYITGETSITSFIGAFMFGVGGDNLLHEVGKTTK